MKNFTQKLKSLLLVACCLCGLSAYAQEEASTLKVGENTVEIVATHNPQVQVQAGAAYTGEVIGFNAADVASALNLSDITLAAQYIVNADDTCVENTTDGWRDKDGNAAGWGSGEGMVCVKINDPASGIVDYIGAIDETHVQGDTYVARWAFVNETVAVVINVNIAFVNSNPTSVFVGDEEIPVCGTWTSPVEVFEKTVYSGDTTTFDAAAVAEALGIGSIADAQAYILNLTTGQCVENTTDGWRNGYGDAAGWGTSASMMCVKIQDPASGIIDYIGAIDETHVKAENPGYVASWAFVANGKAYIVNTVITFVVDPSTLVVVPDPEVDMTKVNVLKTASVSSERFATDGYETSAVELNISDLAAVLGIENKEDLASVFDQIIYVPGTDELRHINKTLQPLTLTDGWLIQAYEAYEDGDGTMADPLDYCVGAGYGSDCKFFVQKMAYDAATDNVSFVVGQYPGNLNTGENWPVDLYVLWGDKAYVINYTMMIVEPKVDSIDQMEQVGETMELTYEQEPTTDYRAVNIVIDTQAIAEMLGCAEENLHLRALANEEGFSLASTANNGGWWFNKDGFVTSYGSGSTFFIEPIENGNYSSLNMGQMPGVLAPDDVTGTDLYFVYGEKYVKVKIIFNIKEKEENGDWTEWQTVGIRVLNVQQLVNDGYVWSEKAASITAADLAALIGTTAPELYALRDPATVEEGANPYTNDYTMGEKPGFWLSPEGYMAAWGNNAPWGMTCQASTTGVTNGIGFKTMQMPGEGVLGNSYSGTFFLVNTENGKMLEVKLNCQVVNSIIESEIVGTGSMVVAVSNDDFEAPFDLTEIAQAIGYESADDMVDQNVLFGVMADGSYSTPSQPQNYLNLDTDCYVTEDESGQIFLIFENGNIYTSANDFVPAEDWMHTIELYFEHPETGKRYVLKLTLMSQEGYTGVEDINVAEGKDSIYDLSGRKVSKAQKGIYIINNKKVIK